MRSFVEAGAHALSTSIEHKSCCCGAGTLVSIPWMGATPQFVFLHAEAMQVSAGGMASHAIKICMQEQVSARSKRPSSHRLRRTGWPSCRRC